MFYKYQANEARLRKHTKKIRAYTGWIHATDLDVDQIYYIEPDILCMPLFSLYYIVEKHAVE